MRFFLLFETIFGETFFDFNNLSFVLHERTHFMFCSHRVSLEIKSRCDALFEVFESLCTDLSVLGLELNSWLGP